MNNCVYLPASKQSVKTTRCITAEGSAATEWKFINEIAAPDPATVELREAALGVEVERILRLPRRAAERSIVYGFRPGEACEKQVRY